jgi:hypothetical protein
MTTTPEMTASARRIGEAMISVQRAKGKAKIAALDEFRAANRASREQHGDDLHEVVKAMAIAGVDG